jgi:Protein of unknown function (DUF3102)
VSAELVEPSGFIQRKAISLAQVINSAAEANSAHRRIVGSVQDAIAIGEFLTMKKQSLPHGKWLPWISDNLEFDRRTSTNYMRLYDKRETVSHLGLTEAYKLLSAPVRNEDQKPKPQTQPTPAKPPKKEPASAFRPQEIESEIVNCNQATTLWTAPEVSGGESEVEPQTSSVVGDYIGDGFSKPVTDDEKVIRRFKTWSKKVASDWSLTPKQVKEYVRNYLTPKSENN